MAQTVTPSAMPITSIARVPVLLVLGGLACVLLIAAANLANLLLVRASGRQREIQVRVSLGATTRQLLTQTLTEAGVVTLIGGTVGVGLAVILTRIARTSAWLDLPRLAEVDLTWSAVAVAGALSIGLLVAFGALPLLQFWRTDPLAMLRRSPGNSTDPRTARVQKIALVMQVAVALVLSVAGGLLFKSLQALLDVDPGFNPSGVAAMRIDPAGRLALPARMPFFRQTLGAVAAVPGVQSAAITINLPMDRNMGWDVALPEEPPDPNLNSAFARIVSPGYFATLGIAVMAGRDFDDRDQASGPSVMAVNQTLARRIAAAGREPLGATLVVNGRPREVIAVVADVKHQTLRRESGREFYIPFTQAPGWQAFDLVIRAAQPLALVPSVREAIWRVDRNQAIGTPVALQQLVDRTLQPHRVLGGFLGGFAMTAVLLAVLGVYGVVGYRVAQRTKEIAIRVALGATHRRLTASMLKESFGLVARGLLVGSPLALTVGEAMRSYLFGVSTDDVPTVVTACGLIMAATLSAAYLPARRAPRIDPIAALRSE
jgi:predicted permease